MRLAPIIELLAAQCALLNGRADYAQSLGSQGPIKSGDQIPAVFVHPWAAEADGEITSLVKTQRRKNAFGLIIVALNSGGDSEPLEDVRKQIQTALYGYEFPTDDPGLNYSPCGYVSGQIIDITGGYVWWRDIYSADDWPRKSN